MHLTWFIYFNYFNKCVNIIAFKAAVAYALVLIERFKFQNKI